MRPCKIAAICLSARYFGVLTALPFFGVFELNTILYEYNAVVSTSICLWSCKFHSHKYIRSHAI